MCMMIADAWYWFVCVVLGHHFGPWRENYFGRGQVHFCSRCNKKEHR